MTHLETQPAVRVQRAGQAGLLATLVMLSAQLIWRLEWSKDGVVQAFPEFIVAAIARLTPLSLFGAATENYGSLAKKSLFVAVLLGILAVGYQAGKAAGALSWRWRSDAAGRLIASVALAGILLLVTLVVILPIAYLGMFATRSSYTSDILIQLSITFALWAICWTVFTTPGLQPQREADDAAVSRRSFLGDAAWNVATLAGIATVGLSAWRLMHPRRAKGDALATEQRARDIVATQRARQGHPMPTSTPTSVSQAAQASESAALLSDITQENQDPFALFLKLEEEKKLTPVLTPTPDFYQVSKNISDPSVGVKSWRLKVTGLVNRELELTYDELVARATTKKITTLCCISNELNGDLISTAEWTGLPLAELLAEAGIQDGAVDLKFHAADDYEDSVSVQIGMDPDNLIVVAMNGEPLPEEHGFPARLIIPNIYGMKNVKWLDRIEVVNEDFQGYWQTRGWSDLAVMQIWGRIDTPRDGETLPPGPALAAGVASAGDRDIARVEVSLDDGQTWADAILEPALNPPFTWVRWAFPFEAVEGKHTMRIRVTDGTGAVMPKEERSPLPDGATGWPARRFRVKA
jgi:DMSO/TMAO reductase YedYZ molybdopterin-dependent catalytic subunit